MLSSYSSYSIHLILKSHVGPIHIRVVPSTAFAISGDDKYICGNVNLDGPIINQGGREP